MKNTGKTLSAVERWMRGTAHWTHNEVKAIRRKRGTIEVQRVDPWGFRRVRTPLGEIVLIHNPMLDEFREWYSGGYRRALDDYYRIFWPRTWFLKNLD